MVAKTSAAAARNFVMGDFIVLSFAVCSRRGASQAPLANFEIPSVKGKRQMRLGRAATGGRTTAGEEGGGERRNLRVVGGRRRRDGRGGVRRSSVLSSFHRVVLSSSWCRVAANEKGPGSNAS